VSENRNEFRFDGKEPVRLDKFLVQSLPDSSRSRIQSFIRDGQVLVNGVAAQKSGQILDRPAIIEVYIPQPAPTDLIPEEIPLDIVFENEDLMVINKPAGMVVHPAIGHTRGTLVHAALGHAPDIEGVGGEVRPGVVHRLDKNTSGLIILAKKERAHRWLQDQFRLRKVQKVYLALVDGHPPTPIGRIEVAIGRSAKDRKLMVAVLQHKGRASITEYKTLEVFPEHTLLEVHPETGRTHQIRVHMQFLGCPVAGDVVYGRKKSTIPVERHFLHAAQLTLRLVGEKSPRTFQAPLPEALNRVLGMLRSKEKK
jgi:23S rRNA pseudouridine1911/1915/1917 synthase